MKICIDKADALDKCPKSCCMCKESPSDRFYKKHKKSTGEVVDKPCSSIEKFMSPKQQKSVCDKPGSDGFGPARAVCPQSCGICPMISTSPYYDDTVMDDDPEDDMMDDYTPELFYGSGIVDGEFCTLAVYFVGCNSGAPDFDPEGMVCMNDGQEDEMYCSYGLSDTACALCLDGDGTDDAPTDDGAPDLFYGSGVVNGEECSLAVYYEGCDPSFFLEGDVCYDDGMDTFYCSYDLSGTACALCLDDLDD